MKGLLKGKAVFFFWVSSEKTAHHVSDQETFRKSRTKYPPGNGYISHQTGKPENHRLKMPTFWGICKNSLEEVTLQKTR